MTELQAKLICFSVCGLSYRQHTNSNQH